MRRVLRCFWPVLGVLLSVWAGAEAHGRPNVDSCPRLIASYEEFEGALSCPLCGCNSLRLGGHESLSNFALNKTFPGAEVEGNWTISGTRATILDMDPVEGRLSVGRGSGVVLDGLTLATGLKPIKKSTYLVPEAVNLSKSATLSMRGVTILSHATTLQDCIAFAENNMDEDAFEVITDEGGTLQIRYLRIMSWEFKGVLAENVTITTMAQPELVQNQAGQRLVATQSQSLLKALKIASDSTDDFSKVEIANDIALSPKDWSFASVTIRRNISISGVRAPIMPALDVSLINSAVIVVPGAHLEIDGVELVNLAPGDPERGSTTDYAAHLWFFLSERDDLKPLRVKNSRLVLTCVEVKHFQYALSSRLDASQRDAMKVDIANLASRNRYSASQEDARSVQISFAEGFGVDFFNVTMTCIPPLQARPLKSEGRLISPQTIRAPSDDRLTDPSRHRNPRRFDHDDHSHGGSTPFIIFKVTLALLVPVFLLLVGAFLWRLRKLKAQVGEWRSNEDSKSIGLTGTQKGQRKSQLEDVPATCSSDRTTGQLPSSKLASWDIRRNQHATEFIPDIMAVAENIDDKQLVLLELLGQGSSGTVHKGLWRELSVAVKTIIFRGGQCDSQERQQAAIREVAITSGLTHPNVVCTYSYDVKRLTSTADMPESRNEQMGMWDDFSDWKLYIIQEYCDGGSLKKGLEVGCLMDRKYGGPEMEKGLEIASGVARGVHHIHSKNIIHGDLKPNNVLLKKTDRNRSGLIAKIADFGLSLKMHGSQTHVSNVQGGTPFYMAPEVLECGNAGKPADVYAFGVILWEMYMSHFSPTGIPTPHALSSFPKLPWSCPVLYGVLTVACMNPDPTQRPCFQDILDVLSHMWQQLRQRMMIAPAQSRVSRLDGDRGFDSGDMEAGRAAFDEAICVMSPVFRDLSFQQVYWCQDC